MVIWGGAIGGYCETGRVLIANRPASITRMAITTAKMGRCMKNLGTKLLLYLESDKVIFCRLSVIPACPESF
jgi:hypothetical protein